MKLYFLTGAGVSAESGIPTYRDAVDGLWYNHKIEDVATAEAIENNPQYVYDFFNMMRKKMGDHAPNSAHEAIAELEKYHDVIVVTQNVDTLHEQAGSTKVLHLHGNLSQMRATKWTKTKYYPYDRDINVGDKCPVLNAQLRPDVVLFGEAVPMLDAANEVDDADMLIVVGTSLYVYPAAGIVQMFLHDRKPVYYVDPNPSDEIQEYTAIHFVKKTATEGMKELLEELTTPTTLTK